MTSLKFLLFLRDKLETPYVVSYFFYGLLSRKNKFPADGLMVTLRVRRWCSSATQPVSNSPLFIGQPAASIPL